MIGGAEDAVGVTVELDLAGKADISAIVIYVSLSPEEIGHWLRLEEIIKARAKRDYPGALIVVRFT